MEKSILKRSIFCLGFLITSGAFSQTFQGMIQTLVVDNFDQSKSSEIYQLTNNSKIYNLNFPLIFKKQLLNVGDEVTISGTVIKEQQHDAIQVESIKFSKHRATVKRNFLDKRTVVSILINFNDKRATNTVRPDDVDGVLFSPPNSVSDLYRVSSFGQVKFERSTNSAGSPSTYVVGLPYDAGNSCDFERWGRDASAIISQSGVNVNAYTHRLYVLPSDVNCPFGGVAYLDCAPCEAWALGYSVLQNLKSTIAHEFGHNFGVRHAATDLNNDDVIDFEYGDTSCPMSTGNTRQFNAPHREMFGWFESFPNKIMEVTTSGQYVITALDVGDMNELQVLKINAGVWGSYYVSLRASLPPFEMGSFFVDRLSIHRAPRFTSRTNLVSVIGTGETFSDPARGVKISLVGSYLGCAGVVNVILG